MASSSGHAETVAALTLNGADVSAQDHVRQFFKFSFNLRCFTLSDIKRFYNINSRVLVVIQQAALICQFYFSFIDGSQGVDS